ncbi:hypothetical protein H5410_014476 [Solanum commersonii]|uniref:OTU domain-containing protein n=1 Tax=Solanum commersonii TaxID=4109 RepID=A0A9J5ZRI6_SOLCO|nr:hypothetical protein H5410_014476 [Solanum commersonii]
MAKTKHQKSKPNKQSHAKKHGKQTDISEFRAQLDALGLKIIQVTADGNCFFRALGDQLEGNEEEHEKYRAMTVKFIRGFISDPERERVGARLKLSVFWIPKNKAI